MTEDIKILFLGIILGCVIGFMATFFTINRYNFSTHKNLMIIYKMNGLSGEMWALYGNAKYWTPITNETQKEQIIEESRSFNHK